MQFIYNIFISAVAAATDWSVSAAAALHAHFWSDCFQWKSWWQTYQDEVLQPVFVALLQQYSTLRLFQGDNAHPHTAGAVQAFLDKKHIRTLP